MKHGYSAYGNHKCRCDECRGAHRAYQREFRQRPRAPESLEHGSNNTYTNYGCRCEQCRAAAAARQRLYRQRLYRQRLYRQRLVAASWS
jgi:hypothetical protein